MDVRPARYFDYKPRQPVPFMSEPNPTAELRAENPLTSQLFEVAHVGTDILLDHVHSGPVSVAGGVAALAVGAVAAGWGVARARSQAWPDKLDAIGHLAVAGASGLHALEHIGNVHLPGLGLCEVVHGLATVGVGVSDWLRADREGPAERRLVGASQIAMGVALTVGGLVPHLAPAAHLVAAGALVVKTVALNYPAQMRSSGKSSAVSI